MAEPSDRLVWWLTIGGSSRDVARRRVGWRIDEFGWDGLIRQTVTPAVRKMRDAGVPSPAGRVQPVRHHPG